MTSVALLLVLLAAPGIRAQLENQYVDLLPGTLNVILSSPHGGDEEPAGVPDRDYGCFIDGACVWSHDCGNKDEEECDAVTTKDLFTQELTRELRDALCAEFGECPVAVINLLHRRKHDANREKDEATFGVPEIEAAWDVYHGLLTEARNNQTGPALVLDIHGHGHPNDWAELGYLITSSNLDSGNFVPADTSIYSLSTLTSADFEELLRGPTSFGGFLEAAGFWSVPGPVSASPEGESYFSGGYITRAHGSRDGGSVDCIQIESPRTFRDDQRPEYVTALTSVVRSYMETHYPARKNQPERH